MSHSKKLARTYHRLALKKSNRYDRRFYGWWMQNSYTGISFTVPEGFHHVAVKGGTNTELKAYVDGNQVQGIKL